MTGAGGSWGVCVFFRLMGIVVVACLFKWRFVLEHGVAHWSEQDLNPDYMCRG